MDRAALDAAIELGVRHGGWCPHGRRAEDGRIANHYNLDETDSPDYLQRTEWNVRDSDATLILTMGPVEGGTAATVEYAKRYHKPLLVIDLLDQDSLNSSLETAHDWLADNQTRSLNVAGPRASKQPAIYQHSLNFLRELLRT